jgi:transcriptional regulator with XRE-family HTH domain
MKINKGETYSAFVKRVRTAAKLTQAEFGMRLGFTYQTISNWERGANVPLWSQKIVDEFAKTVEEY